MYGVPGDAADIAGAKSPKSEHCKFCVRVPHQNGIWSKSRDQGTSTIGHFKIEQRTGASCKFDPIYKLTPPYKRSC